MMAEDKLAAPLIEAIGEYFEQLSCKTPSSRSSQALLTRLPPQNVTVDDAFIVRYATDSQRGLALHRDGENLRIGRGTSRAPQSFTDLQRNKDPLSVRS